MKALAIIAALAAVSWPALAAAQEPAPESSTAVANSRARGSSHAAGHAEPGAPAGRSETVLDGVAFDLEVSGDEPQASLQLGGFVTRSRSGDEDEGTSQSNWLWSARLTVPVGGSEDLTASSTLDALSDGTTLKLNTSWFWFSTGTGRLGDPAFLGHMRSATANCVREAEGNPALDREQRTARMEWCRNTGRYPTLAFARQYADASVAEVNRSVLGDMWRIGGEGSIGFNRFSYIDSTTLAEVDETKAQYSVAIFGTYYPSDAMSAVIARAEYQNAYEAAEEALVCRPVVVDPADDCVNGISGPPTNVERLNFSLEYRQVFDTRSRLGRFAISPRATIDALTGEFEAELPFYVIPRGESPISPGFRVSYSSEDDEVVFGIFLRTTFSL